ncbi:MAG: hypothetical protein ACM36C_06105 [Acidobacteriota bacterium]
MTRTTPRVRRKVVWGSGVAVCTLLAAIAFAGCGQSREGRGPVVLVLDSLSAASGATPDKFANVLSSDVQTIVRSGTERVPSILEDPGQASFHLQMKDNQYATAPSNAITVTRYHVTFIRADGRNTPGVDVPYGFDGAVSETISSSGTVGFIMVRASAKAEPPLVALVGNGGSQFISAIAQVTFYGVDAAGNTVSVTGQMTVSFADWGDPS